MEKAIEIKRRAQRCIQSGDLDGARAEYEKLVAAEDSDPYNFVLLADLLFKRGDTTNAVQRYLSAAQAYEQSGLYKNAIAVCKKMARLSLAPGPVLERLGNLHALDGLATEAAAYFVQYGEHLVRENSLADAAVAYRRAFESVPDDPRLLERVAEVHSIEGDKAAAAEALADAARHYERIGMADAARRCAAATEDLAPRAVAGLAVSSASAGGEPAGEPVVFVADHEAEPQPPSLNAAEGAPGPPSLHLSEIVSTPEPPAESALAGEQAPCEDEAVAGLERFSGGPRGPEVGLNFSPPALERNAREARPERSAASPPGQIEIERLLSEAQERLRNGDPEGGGDLLVEAARAYESAGRLDSAASIYRGLHRGPHAPATLIDLWFENCERRGDRREAAQVACELGDRALQLGDLQGARDWFERARAHDQANSMAQRRLARLTELLSEGSVATESTPPPEPLAFEAPPGPALYETPPTPWEPPPMYEEPAPAASDPEPLPQAAATPASGYEAPEPDLATGPEGGMADRIEMALGRSEAVTFDLGSLLSEFQRGIEAQLSGDAQSHYDLAMAYREMGLVEQAVESFRIAASDPAFTQRAAEMIGRCMLDQGRFEDAAQEFTAALDLEAEGSGVNLDLRYQLGLAHEAGGNLREAAAQFEQVRAVQPTYRDVAAKLRALGKSEAA